MSKRVWIEAIDCRWAEFILHFGMIGCFDSGRITPARYSPLDLERKQTVEIELLPRPGFNRVDDEQLREIGYRLLHMEFVMNFGFFESDEPLPSPEETLQSWGDQITSPTEDDMAHPADY